jgi:hypothetical protein
VLLRCVNGGAHPAQPAWGRSLLQSARQVSRTARVCASDRNKVSLSNSWRRRPIGVGKEVLHRSARRDEVPRHLVIAGPLQDRITGQLGSVVAHNRIGLATLLQQPGARLHPPRRRTTRARCGRGTATCGSREGLPSQCRAVRLSVRPYKLAVE